MIDSDLKLRAMCVLTHIPEVSRESWFRGSFPDNFFILKLLNAKLGFGIPESKAIASQVLSKTESLLRT